MLQSCATMKLSFIRPSPLRWAAKRRESVLTCPRQRWVAMKTTKASSTSEAREALLRGKGYRPGDKVVVFDGVCAMCNSGVDFILRNDSRNQFKFAALQSETGKALTDKFGCPSDLSTMVYVEDNKAYVRSDAMLYIGRRLGQVFALPSNLALLLVPKRLRDFVYTDIIAKNRYSVFGKRDECRYVEPGEEHRFLD